VRLPDPIQRVSTRPAPAEDYQPVVETVFCPPNLPGRDGEAAGIDQPGRVRRGNFASDGGIDNFDVERDAGASADAGHCLLEIDVSSVAFEHHHLFSLEHHLASRLRTSFASYRLALARRRDLDLDRRLRLLEEATDDVREKLEICVQAAEREFQVRIENVPCPGGPDP